MQTSVVYDKGVLEIRYPDGIRILEDIFSTRIELDRIKCYRGQCDEEDFGYYTGLADMVKVALDRMVFEYELEHILNTGVVNAAHACCGPTD